MHPCSQAPPRRTAPQHPPCGTGKVATRASLTSPGPTSRKLRAYTVLRRELKEEPGGAGRREGRGPERHFTRSVASHGLEVGE